MGRGSVGMRAALAALAAAVASPIAACSLLTKWDGLTGDDAGSPDTGGADVTGPMEAGAEVSLEATASPDALDAPAEAALACEAGLTACATACADLTIDAMNCGTCGHSCLEGACQGSRCQPIQLVAPSSTLQGVYSIALDGTSVLYSDWCAADLLYEVPAAGGAASAVGNLTGCNAFVVLEGSTSVLVSNTNTTASSSKITRVPRDGSNPVDLVTGISSYVGAMFADGTDLFYSPNQGFGGIVRVDEATGGNPKTITTDAASTFVIDATYVYWSTSTQLRRALKDGTGSASTLYTIAAPASVALYGSTLYWTLPSKKTIFSGPAAGGTATPLTPAPLAYTPGTPLLDATSLYWTSLDGNVVAAMNHDGTGMHTLADTQTGGATGLAVDGSYVYWGRGTAAPSSLWKVAK